MSEFEEVLEDQLPLEGVGQRLRRAREDAQKSIAQIAAETRIPQRHLVLIEAGKFSALPARTYAIGFSRSYAKALGLDDRVIADQVRDELANSSADEGGRAIGFEPGDPARISSRGLAWFSALAALLLIAGGFAYFRDFFFTGAGPGPQVADSQPAVANTPVTPAADLTNSGAVVFTALEDGVWVRFYDTNGTRFAEKQMAKGESFTIPADATDPKIWTGRPDAFSITIGGKAVPKLAEKEQILRDVSVSAAALQARAENPEAGAAQGPSPQAPGIQSPAAARPAN